MTGGVNTLTSPTLRLDAATVLVSPFGEHSGKFVHLQNIANDHPACMYDEHGGFLDAFTVPGVIDGHALGLAATKSTRMVAPTRGNTTIPRRTLPDSPLDHHVQQTIDQLHGKQLLTADHLAILEQLDTIPRDFLVYLLRFGLLEPDSLNNLVFVESFFNFDDILRQVALTGKTAIPFTPAPAFIDLCSTYGVPVRSITTPNIGKLGNKYYFRKAVEELLPDAFPFPQLHCEPGEAPDVYELKELVNYSLSCQRDPLETPGVLFIQKEVSAGGVGNYLIRYEDATGTYLDAKRGLSFGSLDELSTFIRSLSDATLTAPYLQVVASPAVGMLTTPDGVSLFGPTQQILNESFDYQGFTYNAANPVDEFEPAVAKVVVDHLEQIRHVAMELGARKKAAGYVGYSNIDLMVFPDTTGRLRLSYSEDNVRFSATCMLQMLVYMNPVLNEQLHAGQLAMMQLDYIPMSHEVSGISNNLSTGIADYLQNLGVPMMDANSTEGAFLMTSPGRVGENSRIGIAVVASVPERRDAIFSRIEAALKSTPE